MTAATASSKTYDFGFYKDRRTQTLHAARRVLGLVFERVAPRSVVDFGCGTGTWLSAAAELGATEVQGVEGMWLKKEWADITPDRIMQTDMSRPITLDRTFDLAISLEVAEHLPEARAGGFVEEICRSAPLVLFAAAIPGQGGTGHVNEQWQSYWAALFAKHGYRALDVIRPAIWSDESIPYWYRQNTLLYAKEPLNQERFGSAGGADLIDLVHPALFKTYASASARTSVKLLLSSLKRRFR